MKLKDRADAPASAPAVNGAAVSVARLTLSKRERRPGYIALLVLLVVGLAAVGGWLYTTAGQKVAGAHAGPCSNSRDRRGKTGRATGWLPEWDRSVPAADTSPCLKRNRKLDHWLVGHGTLSLCPLLHRPVRRGHAGGVLPPEAL